MLIPRYSLARMLLIVTVCAVISLIISFALRGQAWAIGISMALATLALCLLFYACAFLVAYGLATARASQADSNGFSEANRFDVPDFPSDTEAGSPFA